MQVGNVDNDPFAIPYGRSARNVLENLVRERMNRPASEMAASETAPPEKAPVITSYSIHYTKLYETM